MLKKITEYSPIRLIRWGTRLSISLGKIFTGIIFEMLLFFSDNIRLKFGNGTGGDLAIYHNGTDSFVDNSTGALNIRGGGDIIYLKPENGENALVAKPNAEVE